MTDKPANRSWLRPRARWAVFFGLAALVVVADQVSKAWVASNFEMASPHLPTGDPNGPTRVIGDFVRIAVNHNNGGIFGLFGDSAVLLGIVSLIVIGFIVVYEARAGATSHPLLTIALGLLLGGAIGNLIDRLQHGYVIDWVDMGVGNARWFTFNVADAAISIALLLLLMISLFGERFFPSTDEPSAEATSN